MFDKRSLYLHVGARIRFMQLCFEPSNGGTVVPVQVASHLQGQLLRAGARDSAKSDKRQNTSTLSTRSIDDSTRTRSSAANKKQEVICCSWCCTQVNNTLTVTT
jgi:hypothetical protein